MKEKLFSGYKELIIKDLHVSVEGREILANASLNGGTVSLYTYSTLHGLVKISGFY